MISKDDAKVTSYANLIASEMYKLQSCPPDILLTSIFNYSKIDPICKFSYSAARIIVSNYVDHLSEQFAIKFNSCRILNVPNIKNADICEYKYSISDKEFYVSALIKGNYCISSNYALSDALISSKIKHGCSSCKYSEEGCEHCGFNKIRGIINKVESIKTFTKTSKVFYDIVGDHIRPIDTFIGKMLEYEKTSNDERDELGSFKVNRKG